MNGKVKEKLLDSYIEKYPLSKMQIFTQKPLYLFLKPNQTTFDSNITFLNVKCTYLNGDFSVKVAIDMRLR